MKRSSITFAAVFAIIAGVPSPAGAEGPIEAYAGSYNGGNVSFVRTNNAKHLMTMLEPNAGSHSDILFVKTKHRNLDVSASNLLSLPPGGVKIVVHQITPGASLKVRTLSDNGQVVSENFINLAAHIDNSASSQQSVNVPVVAGNRAVLISLIRSNFLGQNAPAIAAVEFDYVEMWAQDVAAMLGYHAGASALAEQIDNSAP